jgi:hypothetical protein
MLLLRHLSTYRSLAQVRYQIRETVLLCVGGDPDEDGTPTSICDNDGVCELRGGAKFCSCATVISAGDLYTEDGAQKQVETDSSLIGPSNKTHIHLYVGD